MNVEGAEVERRLSRSIMPRFHAAFSLGTVAGAGVGAAVTYLGIGIDLHVAVVGVLVATLGFVSVRGFLPTEQRPPRAAAGSALKAWTEPRTLADRA